MNHGSNKAPRPRHRRVAAFEALADGVVARNRPGFVVVGLHLIAGRVLLFVAFVAGFIALAARNSPRFAAALGLAPTILGIAIDFMVVTLLGAAGLALVRRGKRLGAPSGADVLRRDPRPPVLYLRSFADDGADNGFDPLRGVGMATERLTEEEALASALSALGPVVAIGKPGEALPELGAARIYVGDDWQDVVRRMLDGARLIVLRAARTDGFLWEVEAVVRHRRPDKVLLYLPPYFHGSGYDEFRAAVAERLPHPLPAQMAARFVAFDPQWRPRPLPPAPAAGLRWGARRVVDDIRSELAGFGLRPARPLIKSVVMGILLVLLAILVMAVACSMWIYYDSTRLPDWYDETFTALQTPRGTVAPAEPRVSQPLDPPTGEPEGPGRTALAKKAPMTLLRLSGGDFTMGSHEVDAGEPRKPAGPFWLVDDRRDEHPHRVHVGPFEIGTHEVTNRQWKLVMGAAPRGCSKPCPPNEPADYGYWTDVIRFLNRLSRREGLQPCYTQDDSTITWDPRCDGYRLPTEAEWEYAARAGTTGDYGFDGGRARLSLHAWFKENADSSVHAVGAKAPNRWGLFDTHGNAQEWVWDRHEAFDAEPAWDPCGPDGDGPTRIVPELEHARVVRGGDIWSSAEHLRSASRGASVLGNGFRVARGPRVSNPARAAEWRSFNRYR